MSASLFDNECECPEPIECSTYILWTIGMTTFLWFVLCAVVYFSFKKEPAPNNPPTPKPRPPQVVNFNISPDMGGVNFP
uniref:ATP synthase F0 subunit 8 n=1 Tax=Ditylenchus dipsaci TaxID=166011 RepID=A0A915DAY7_9BILA